LVRWTVATGSLSETARAATRAGLGQPKRATEPHVIPEPPGLPSRPTRTRSKPPAVGVRQPPPAPCIMFYALITLTKAAGCPVAILYHFEPNPEIQPFDVVYVSFSRTARIGRPMVTGKPESVALLGITLATKQPH
jgi:hypothetical protein